MRTRSPFDTVTDRQRLLATVSITAVHFAAGALRKTEARAHTIADTLRAYLVMQVTLRVSNHCIGACMHRGHRASCKAVCMQAECRAHAGKAGTAITLACHGHFANAHHRCTHEHIVSAVAGP